MSKQVIVAALLSVLAWQAGTTDAQAQASSTFNVRSYGAAGTGTSCGSTDDTAAVQAAIAAAVAVGGGEIYFPAGSYKLSAPLQTVGTTIAYRGEGQRISILRFCGIGANNGIDFKATTSGTLNNTFAVRSLSILRAGGDAYGAAIAANWPAMAKHIGPSGQMGHGNGGSVTATIEDVHIGSDPWPSSVSYWHWGIQLFNATCMKLQSLNIHGAGIGAGVAGIAVGTDTAAPVNGNAMAVYIRDAQITGWARGVEYKDGSEGFHVHDSNIRDVMWGIIAGGGDITHFVTPGTVISHNQIYATRGGIKVDRMSSLAITHNTIHRIEDADFIGIDINPGIDPDGDPTTPPHADSGAHRIIGNFIFAPAGGTSTKQGIVIQHDENDNVIEGNITVNMQRGIWLMNAAIDGTLVLGNINKNSTTAAIVNGGTNTLLAHNH